MNKELTKFLLPILWVIGFILILETESNLLTAILSIPLAIGVAAVVIMVVNKFIESFQIAKQSTEERKEMIAEGIIDENYFLIEDNQNVNEKT